MHIRQATRAELEAERCSVDRPWFDAVCERLRDLPHPHLSRVLVAEEEGQPRAVLGLSLRWMGKGRLGRARICALGVEPERSRRGAGSLLVRFAEGIARVHGCYTVEVASHLEGLGDGRCWTGLGYGNGDESLAKELRTAPRWRCA